MVVAPLENESLRVQVSEIFNKNINKVRYGDPKFKKYYNLNRNEN